MTHPAQYEKIASAKGFIAALDQSGGSTPKALRQYGVDESAYDNEEDMFALVHEMRSRIITSPAFTGDKVLGAILFEKTMDSRIKNIPTAQYLWEVLNIVPFLKIDKGLDEEQDGVQIMKPIPALSEMLHRAKENNIFGTKMRSVINSFSTKGIEAVVAQQFEVGLQILNHGLTPIIEPEVNIKAADKEECEKLLKEEILKRLETIPSGRQIMLKLTLPEKTNLYKDLTKNEKVLLVVALSGGYDLNEACRRLAENDDMVASFSRALKNGLNVKQSDEEFNAALQSSIDTIYNASVHNRFAAKAA